ncbi:hypothetical protein XELAEV_18018038mg [Xenopus laevis]|uniref:Uncharacterized protein n=1 Tax=Xenopus laevis TaxID=8355 RepID=A0A974HT20_XENLA|nr:hypothetical protein XELAEV_18018038mg [Xenopus laevis]
MQREAWGEQVRESLALREGSFQLSFQTQRIWLSYYISEVRVIRAGRFLNIHSQTSEKEKGDSCVTERETNRIEFINTSMVKEGDTCCSEEPSNKKRSPVTLSVEDEHSTPNL